MQVEGVPLQASVPIVPSVPWAGFVTLAKVRASPSGSVPERVMTLAVFLPVEVLAETAVGAALVAVTVIEMVPLVAELTVPSLTRKVKLSAPV